MWNITSIHCSYLTVHFGVHDSSQPHVSYSEIDIYVNDHFYAAWYAVILIICSASLERGMIWHWKGRGWLTKNHNEQLWWMESGTYHKIPESTSPDTSMGFPLASTAFWMLKVARMEPTSNHIPERMNASPGLEVRMWVSAFLSAFIYKHTKYGARTQKTPMVRVRTNRSFRPWEIAQASAQMDQGIPSHRVALPCHQILARECTRVSTDLPSVGDHDGARRNKVTLVFVILDRHVGHSQRRAGMPSQKLHHECGDIG